jgi:hypothetical protein
VGELQEQMITEKFLTQIEELYDEIILDNATWERGLSRDEIKAIIVRIVEELE